MTTNQYPPRTLAEIDEYLRLRDEDEERQSIRSLEFLKSPGWLESVRVMSQQTASVFELIKKISGEPTRKA